MLLSHGAAESLSKILLMRYAIVVTPEDVQRAWRAVSSEGTAAKRTQNADRTEISG